MAGGGGGYAPVKSLQTAAAISITASLTHVTQLVTGETTATASRPPQKHTARHSPTNETSACRCFRTRPAASQPGTTEPQQRL